MSDLTREQEQDALRRLRGNGNRTTALHPADVLASLIAERDALRDERDDLAEACDLDRALIEEMQARHDALSAQLDTMPWEYGVSTADGFVTFTRLEADADRESEASWARKMRRRAAGPWEAVEDA